MAFACNDQPMWISTSTLPTTVVGMGIPLDEGHDAGLLKEIVDGYNEARQNILFKVSDDRILYIIASMTARTKDELVENIYECTNIMWSDMKKVLMQLGIQVD